MNKKFLVTAVSSTCLAATLFLAPTVEASGGPSTDNTSESDYTVQSGDTLSQIALENGTSVSQLKEVNQLDSDMIYVGQTLHTTSNDNSPDVSDNNNSVDAAEPDTNADTAVNVSADANRIISVAESKIGASYAWGGTGPDAFDSSGFVNYVLAQNGFSPSRTHAAMWENDGEFVSTPEPGDIVFFEHTYDSVDRITHSGIYIGGNQMIHAGTEQTGVEVTPSSDWEYYWSDHYIGAKRF